MIKVGELESYRGSENDGAQSNKSENDRSVLSGAGKFAKDENTLISDMETNPEFVINRAQQNINNLKLFRQQANGILKEAEGKLDQLDTLVKGNMSQGTNVQGFLLGYAKEYKLKLDRENFDLRLDLDIELWEAQIRNASETQKQATRIGDYIEECKVDLTKIMRP